MFNYDWLFLNKDIKKGSSVSRVITSTRIPPITTEYSRSFSSPSFNLNVDSLSGSDSSSIDSSSIDSSSIDSSSIDSSSIDSDLASRATSKLEDAVSHLEVNQSTLNALTTIVEKLNTIQDDYHSSHPNPLSPPESDLSDPPWSKDLSSSQKRLFINQNAILNKIISDNVPHPKFSSNRLSDRTFNCDSSPLSEQNLRLNG